MKVITVYIVFSIFLFSCGNGGNRENHTEKSVHQAGLAALPVLDMEYAYEHVDEADSSFVWNDIIDNVRFIPLETKEECLVSRGISPVLLGNDFVVARFPGLEDSFLFDSSGHFVRRIARMGRGPGEIQSVLMNVMPYQNDRYILFDAAGYQTVIKDREGRWIRTLFNGQYRCLYPHDSGFVYVNQYQRFPNDSTFLCFTDSLGNVVKELKEPGEERLNPDESGIIGGLDHRKIFSTDEKLWLMKSYNDTLFRITKERTIKPYLILHRGKYAPSLKDKDKTTIGAVSYNEIGPYSVILSAVFQIWNRETGKLVAMRKFNAGDNIKYRLPNNRIVQMNLMSIKNGKLIFLTKLSMDEQIREYLHLAEDDNPVLMIADLKED